MASALRRHLMAARCPVAAVSSTAASGGGCSPLLAHVATSSWSSMERRNEQTDDDTARHHFHHTTGWHAVNNSTCRRSSSLLPASAAYAASAGAFGQRNGGARGFASSWFGGGGQPVDPPVAAPSDLPASPVDPVVAVETIAPSATVVSDALCQAEAAAQAVAMSQGWATSSLLIQSMCDMTAALDMPWWAAIVGITLSVRTALFPAMVWMEGIQMKLKVIQPELDRIKQKYPGVYQGDAASQEGLKAESQALFARHNMNPLSGLVLLPLGVTQLFVFGTFFFSLRYLSEAKVPSMMTGGALWFPDLTAPDPTFGLPILAASTMLIAVEAGAMDSPGSGGVMKNAMRAMSASFLLMGPYFPSSLFVYFIASNFFTVGQSSLMSSLAFRRAVGLPPRPKPEPGQADELSKLWSRLKESGEPGAASTPSTQSVRVYSRKPSKAKSAAAGSSARGADR